LLDLGRELKDSLSDAQAHIDRFTVQRLGEEIIDPRVHCLPKVVPARVDRG
jgi:hypothetical protein